MTTSPQVPFTLLLKVSAVNVGLDMWTTPVKPQLMTYLAISEALFAIRCRFSRQKP